LISDPDDNVIKPISPNTTTKELKMLPLNNGLYAPFVIVIITVTAYFSLLITLKPSKDTKLSAYVSQNTKRKSRKRKEKKPLKDLSELKPSEPDSEEKPSPPPSEKKKCPHYVGYLTSLPKGTPFPEECFGCRNVIQCLRVEPTRVIESFYMGASTEA